MNNSNHNPTRGNTTGSPTSSGGSGSTTTRKMVVRCNSTTTTVSPPPTISRTTSSCQKPSSVQPVPSLFIDEDGFQLVAVKKPTAAAAAGKQQQQVVPVTNNNNNNSNKKTAASGSATPTKTNRSVPLRSKSLGFYQTTTSPPTPSSSTPSANANITTPQRKGTNTTTTNTLPPTHQYHPKTPNGNQNQNHNTKLSPVRPTLRKNVSTSSAAVATATTPIRGGSNHHYHLPPTTPRGGNGNGNGNTTPKRSTPKRSKSSSSAALLQNNNNQQKQQQRFLDPEDVQLYDTTTTSDDVVVRWSMDDLLAYRLQFVEPYPVIQVNKNKNNNNQDTKPTCRENRDDDTTTTVTTAATTVTEGPNSDSKNNNVYITTNWTPHERCLWSVPNRIEFITNEMEFYVKEYQQQQQQKKEQQSSTQNGSPAVNGGTSGKKKQQHRKKYNQMDDCDRDEVVVDATVVLRNTVLSILNKLSWTNLEKLTLHFLQALSNVSSVSTTNATDSDIVRGDDNDDQSASTEQQSQAQQVQAQQSTKNTSSTRTLNDQVIHMVMSLVVSKAITEPHFADLYAQLIHNLTSVHKTFKRCVLLICQEQFDTNTLSSSTSTTNTTTEVVTTITTAALDSNDTNDTAVALNPSGDVPITTIQNEKKETTMMTQMSNKKIAIGLMKFIGELYKLSIIKSSIMINCLQQLLIYDNDEEKLECFAKLLTTVGCKLQKDIPMNSKHYPIIEEMWEPVYAVAGKKQQQQQQHGKSRLPSTLPLDSATTTTTTTSNDDTNNNQQNSTSKYPTAPNVRIKFMFQSLIELKDNDWIQIRHEPEKAKTIEQIHQEIAAEEEIKKQQQQQQNQWTPSHQNRSGVPQSPSSFSFVTPKRTKSTTSSSQHSHSYHNSSSTGHGTTSRSNGGNNNNNRKNIIRRSKSSDGGGYYGGGISSLSPNRQGTFQSPTQTTTSSSRNVDSFVMVSPTSMMSNSSISSNSGSSDHNNKNRKSRRQALRRVRSDVAPVPLRQRTGSADSNSSTGTDSTSNNSQTMGGGGNQLASRPPVVTVPIVRTTALLTQQMNSPNRRHPQDQVDRSSEDDSSFGGKKKHNKSSKPPVKPKRTKSGDDLSSTFYGGGNNVSKEEIVTNTTTTIVPTKPQNATDYVHPTDCRTRIQSILKEYFISNELQESVRCVSELIGEMNSPNQLERCTAILESSILMVMEMKDIHVQQVLQLITECMKTQSVNSISSNRMHNDAFLLALNEPLEFLRDIEIDAPLASTFLANIIGDWIQKGYIPNMDILLNHIITTGPEYFRSIDGRPVEFVIQIGIQLQLLQLKNTHEKLFTSTEINLIEKLMTQRDMEKFTNVHDFIQEMIEKPTK